MPDDHGGPAAPLEPGRPHPRPEEGARHGRLSFRPGPPAGPATATATGLVLVAPGGDRLGLAWVPPRPHDGPLRTVLLLHGAEGSAERGLDLLLPIAEERRLLLVAALSASSTWDVIVEGYGRDVRRIDRLLAEVSAGYPVGRLAVGGFSDGASYALSLGMGNGDLFDAVVAFSPGFAAPLVRHGRPRTWISHGTRDRVLPIDRCSRRLVPQLERAGDPVTYVEFDGGHEAPAAIVAQAADWLG